MIELTLPWPDRALSPNASKRHWRSKQEAKVAARHMGYCRVRYGTVTPQGKLHMMVMLYPPDRRCRDMDNVLASLKPYIDGVCLGLAIDDVIIRKVTLEWGDVVKGGSVTVRLEEMVQDAEV